MCADTNQTMGKPVAQFGCCLRLNNIYSYINIYIYDTKRETKPQKERNACDVGINFKVCYII